MDNLSVSDRRKAMRAVKNKRTSLERSFAAQLASLGIRGWVCNPKSIFGSPDFAFRDSRIAVFIDGCFWHGCKRCQKPLPATNFIYWKSKIERNVKRANRVTRRLRAEGWTVIRFWEHEFKKSDRRSKAMNKVLGAIKIPRG